MIAHSFLMIFLAFDICWFCVVIQFFHRTSPPQRLMTSDFEGFSIPNFIHHIYFSDLNSWERASIFPFECSVLNKGTTGTIFITSLVWRRPWLGIEPGTSCTRSQHYTTRLSRRRWAHSLNCYNLPEGTIFWAILSYIQWPVVDNWDWRRGTLQLWHDHVM